MANVVTWNMQGSNWTSDFKWYTGIGNLFAHGADIICLQECGSPPASAVHVWQSPLDPQLHIFQWGTPRTLKYILFYHWDLHGNRVNMAIVTRLPIAAANVLPVLYPAMGAVWRPAIGITIGGLCYYTLHAISPGGADAAGLLGAIAGVAPATAIVAGDYNQAPVAMLGGMFNCPPNGPTHSTRVMHPANTYDYIHSNVGLIANAVGMVVGGLIASDHYPVAYAL
ncbi:endonuclease/exonuclease/phosphatase family protein [Pseudoduganella sp. S-14]|jgi:cytolethal distending toxin subunit B|uniref:endonuclease/exonuclease/phosphatase family protein n=1 Tax=Pseudoduganella sp. S-14 TaxID=3404065 RepID=UPI003CF0A952